jgi:hypothetical protein
VEGELFVLHRDMGRVQEIGIGGILFTYVEQLRLQGNYPRKGIIFTEDDLVVELPFKTFSDAYLDHLPSGQVNTRQRIILFDDLAADQLDQLEELILGNVDIPVMEDYVTMDELTYWA